MLMNIPKTFDYKFKIELPITFAREYLSLEIDEHDDEYKQKS